MTETIRNVEDAILSTVNVIADLGVLYTELVDNPEYSKQATVNFIHGLGTVYEAKFMQLAREFEALKAEHLELEAECNELEAELAAQEIDDQLMDALNDALYSVFAEHEGEQSLADIFAAEEEAAFLEEQERAASEDDLEQRFVLVEDELTRF